MTTWEIPPGLGAAYRACRDVHRRHGRTYYLATTLLPRERRPHVWALYAFARTADDLVDHPREDPAVALPAWRDVALTVLGGATAPPAGGDPVLAATWHTRTALGLDLRLFEDFLASMIMDLTVTRYASWEELRRYMRGSAAAIGEMMAPLLGAADPGALRPAGALGEAFQFTNFVRDVAEDLRRGRVYLPAEDLAAHGVKVADLARSAAQRAPTPAVRGLVAAQTQRGLDLYDLARPGLGLVDARSRACLEVAFTLYREILVEVERHGFNVFDGRIRVSRAARAAAVARSASARRR